MPKTTITMITTTVRSPQFLLLAVLLLFPNNTGAFQIPVQFRNLVTSTRSRSCVEPVQIARTTTQLQNLFGDLFGQQDKQERENSGTSDGAAAPDNPIVDVMEIPARVIKIKPLKFYLQLFLVSQQNTPVKGAWLLNANEEVEDYLEVYYADGTGMISVQFDDLYGIRIQRKGKRPSLQYMLQESVLLHALLDELEAIAFGDGDGDVDEDKRLLQFADENKDVLSKAREDLPARAAPSE